VHHERYTVYWKVYGTGQWPELENEWKAQDGGLAPGAGESKGESKGPSTAPTAGLP
jgi:hypothetical protein